MIPTTMTLEAILDSLTVEDIKALIKTVPGTKPKVTRKADLIEWLLATLKDPTRLEEIYESMEDIEQKAVTAAYHNEGTLNLTAFQAQYGQNPYKSGQSYFGRWYSYSTTAMHLFLHQMIIPDDLMPLVGKLVPEPERFHLTGSPDLPAKVTHRQQTYESTVVLTEGVGSHDLRLYLRLFENGTLRRGANDALTGKGFKVLLENLLEGDFATGEGTTFKSSIRPFGIDSFAHISGLVTAEGLSELGKRFLHEGDSEALLEAFETWTHHEGLDEALRIKRGRLQADTSPEERRERLMEALSWCPVGEWLSWLDFDRALKIWGFDVAVEAVPETMGSIISSLNGVRHIDLSDLYPEAQLRENYVKVLLFETLGSLGVVDLAFVPQELIESYRDTFSRYEGLTHFRITPLGAYLLGQADSYSLPERSPLFRITADLKLSILEPDALTPELRAGLAQVADESKGSYTLSRKAMLTALENGVTPDALQDFLEKGHEGDLLPEVTGWLEEVFGNAQVFSEAGRALLVTVREKGVLEQALADAKIGRYARQLDHETLVIPAAQENAFRNRLKDLGYLL